MSRGSPSDVNLCWWQLEVRHPAESFPVPLSAFCGSVKCLLEEDVIFSVYVELSDTEICRYACNLRLEHTLSFLFNF